ICLAQHGWAAPGVDMVPEALAEARRRATEAGVQATFVEGDVTRLAELGLESGFGVLVDAGCFHTLPASARDAYVDGVTELAATGATMLLFGFGRGRFAPIRAGVSPDEVRDRFHRWSLEEAGRFSPFELLEEAGSRPVAARVGNVFDLWHFRLQRL
ncbi:MAG: class I SAM-dependent methyltransferase, partial [Candidatus Dormibacteraeota bacterium]|nr:class I SAM-dependent methyltransferase [Candidatus Dormibacteraeota bacterium]